MRTFSCTCGSDIFFENTRCLTCGRRLAFDPDSFSMLAFNDADIGHDPDNGGGRWWHGNSSDSGNTDERRAFKPCRNGVDYQTCNWLVPMPKDGSEPEGDGRCSACALNQQIPDLGAPRRIELWFEVEKAKRRLLFTLLSLHLPVVGKADDPNGLAFRILSDGRLDGVDTDASEHVYTGHANGLITINLLEADASMREQMRQSMNESYRTLLGHFRHESGHHYWNVLVAGRSRLDDFRALFGDDSEDYGESLQRYYAGGPPTDWSLRFISAYASSHPLEDFAETWAHYMHMVDTLETANDAGTEINGRQLANPVQVRSMQFQFAIPYAIDFDRIQSDWTTLTQMMNRLNRSMGLDDPYPFSLTPAVVEKLRFVHSLIHAL